MFTAKPLLNFMLYAIFWKIRNTYMAAGRCKILTKGIVNYSEVKNIISINNNDNISVYS